jgi:glycosyltransferase involved in cell wall biosynthesis
LPALEALACGTPTVTSNTSSPPEVVGEAALLVEPTEETAIATAIERLLLDDPLRQRLRQASIHQAAKFSWQTAAKLTAETYARALARKN